MKITYDNIIYSLQKAGGISIYWTELVKRVIKREKVIFYESKNENIFRKEISLDVKKESNIKFKILRYLPFSKKIESKSIFHSSYYRITLQNDVINITTVHDFTYEYFSSGLAKYIHTWQKSFAIKKSEGIICVSENTKKDLLKFYPMIKESKIKVIYNGVGDEFVNLDNSEQYLKDELESLKWKNYILFVGDRSSYKNFNMTINVIKKMQAYYLVIIGGKEFSNYEKDIMKDVKDRVYHFKGISGNKLNIFYNNAFCLFYPSSYEGFGIPIVEAMKAGCPVISTNISSIPEIAGDAALLVDNIDVDSFCNEIRKLENNEFRNEQKLKGLEQAKKFSWDKCFDDTYNFYKEIWNKKFGK